MDLTFLLEYVEESWLAALFGLVTGLTFGIAAQRSAFCLRAATIEFARGGLGPRMAVWLLTFSSALILVQTAELRGFFHSSEARMMAVTGSWSGAIIGGLLFGSGMVLARGCSGRLLVLAATGNLRSLMSGLVFAVVAQMSLFGLFAPARQWIAGLWVTPGGQNVDLLSLLTLPKESGLILGIVTLLLAVRLAVINDIDWQRLIFAPVIGAAVALGWVLTYSLAQVAFEPQTVTSATFSGPSASTLMFFLETAPELGFDVGLIPGVFLGALLSSLASGQFRFQGFEGESQMRRSLTGAAMMGFGAMLAGGCAIGAGVSGGSIFVATAWLALTAMWAGAVITDIAVDQRAVLQPT